MGASPAFICLRACSCRESQTGFLEKNTLNPLKRERFLTSQAQLPRNKQPKPPYSLFSLKTALPLNQPRPEHAPDLKPTPHNPTQPTDLTSKTPRLRDAKDRLTQ